MGHAERHFSETMVGHGADIGLGRVCPVHAKLGRGRFWLWNVSASDLRCFMIDLFQELATCRFGQPDVVDISRPVGEALWFIQDHPHSEIYAEATGRPDKIYRVLSRYRHKLDNRSYGRWVEANGLLDLARMIAVTEQSGPGGEGGLRLEDVSVFVVGVYEAPRRKPVVLSEEEALAQSQQERERWWKEYGVSGLTDQQKQERFDTWAERQVRNDA
ncbi:MAG: hypothetical protein AAFW83_10350 [Pseudomonadota bacterium]